DELMLAVALVGIYGLTFIALLLATTPALIWPADGRSLTQRMLPFFLALLVLVAQLGYGSNRLTATTATERQDVTLRLVQPLVYEHRSEEHTSELQSRENLVCRLLLEKKKKNQ